MSIRQSDFYLLPNLVSLSRVAFIPIVIVLIYYELNLWALVAFLLAGITDYFDGWLARKYNYESKLGMLLDPLADKLLILSTMIMLLWIGRLRIDYDLPFIDLVGPVLVIVTVGREMAITGLRAIASSAGIVVAADKGGKLKTWIQFVAISMLLLAYSYLLEVGQVLLIISVIAALWSGVRYVLKFIRGLPV